MVNNTLDNSGPEQRHTLRQPMGHTAAMQWKISHSGAFHYLLGYKEQRIEDSKRAEEQDSHSWPSYYYGYMNGTGAKPHKDLRRSTRVPIRIRIEVQATGHSCDGETIVVNLHGALVKTSNKLELGARIKIHVQLTGKSAEARVVFASRQRPLEFGIALNQPQNIWGVSLPPADWTE